jgi:hypothetical protein
MIFEQALLPKLHLREFDTTEGRYYQTPIGDLPSVTTVLKSFGDKTGLNSWKEYIDGRDGPGSADKITHQTSRKGNAAHHMAERYLSNDTAWRESQMPVNIAEFSKIRGILDANVTKVYGLEYAVYGQLLRSAGRVDIIASWNGFDSIIDLKTALRPVSPTGEKLTRWQYQTTAYALMLEERFKRPFEQGIILTMVAKEKEPQIFIFNNMEFRDKVQKIFTKRQ